MILVLLKPHIVLLKMAKSKDEVVFLDAFQESDKYIAQADTVND